MPLMCFFRTKVVVDPSKQTVILEGDRTLLLGDQVLATDRESYRLGFINFAGRVLLNSIERGEEKK